MFLFSQLKSSNSEKHKYTPINLLRLFAGLITIFISFQLSYIFLELFSIIYFSLALFWLVFALLGVINEEGKIAYLTTVLDLTVFGYFVYITGAIGSPLTIGLLFTTAVSSLNLKLYQGLLALVYGSCLYLILAFAVYFEWIPLIQPFGDQSKITILGFLVAVSVFIVSNISLYFFVRNLSLSNLELLRQKDLEKEKTETALKSAEASNLSKRYFLANMSHEIRTPMNGIIGLASLLKKTELSEEQLDFLDSIEISADNLITILNDILDFSKIEANKLALVPETFNLEKLVIEVNSLFKAKIREKKIVWKLSFDPKLPKWIYTDPIRLKQVLVNLIGNAVKFTPTSGSIHLDILLEHVINEIYHIRFVVTDTGIGIPDDKLKLLFQPFEQADRTTTRKFGGTGLGLTISDRLVKMMGGTFEVESKPDVGSKFSFSIQSKSIVSMISQSISSSVSENPSGKIRINKDLRLLSVDDNEINQKFILKFSNLLNLNFDFAKNGKEAVFLHFLKPYDIILMDMQMPIMDGLEATRRIRAFEKRSHRSSIIVAMTANAFEEDKNLCTDAGMDDFLAKPIKMEAIVELISKYAEK